MSEDTLIKNCTFVFKCPQIWERLSKTDNETVRFCNACEKDVYLAEDTDAFSLLASLGNCVAVRDLSTEEVNDTEGVGFLLGIPATTNASFDFPFVINPPLPRSAFSDGETLFLNRGLEDLRGQVPGYCLNDCSPGTDGAVYSIDQQEGNVWELYRCLERLTDSDCRIEVARVGEKLTVEELYERIEAVGIFVLGREAIALGLPFHGSNF